MDLSIILLIGGIIVIFIIVTAIIGFLVLNKSANKHIGGSGNDIPTNDKLKK